MIKIDLHLHTKYSSLNGDKVVNIPVIEMAEKLKENGVKAASFTDHNIFSKDFYLKSKKIFERMGINFFPGVEVDVVRPGGKIGHVIILADHNESDNIEKFDDLVRENFGKRKINLENFFALVKSLDSLPLIVIPHVGKDDYFKYNEISKYQYDAVEASSLDNRNLKKYIKEASHPVSLVAFSDTHAWNKYPQNDKLFTYVPGDVSFSGLKSAMENNRVVLGDKYHPDLEKTEALWASKK